MRVCYSVSVPKCQPQQHCVLVNNTNKNLQEARNTMNKPESRQHSAQNNFKRQSNSQVRDAFRAFIFHSVAAFPVSFYLTITFTSLILFCHFAERIQFILSHCDYAIQNHKYITPYIRRLYLNPNDSEFSLNGVSCILQIQTQNVLVGLPNSQKLSTEVQ